jgi:hypothetical protein
LRVDGWKNPFQSVKEIPTQRAANFIQNENGFDVETNKLKLVTWNGLNSFNIFELAFRTQFKFPNLQEEQFADIKSLQ